MQNNMILINNIDYMNETKLQQLILRMKKYFHLYSNDVSTNKENQFTKYEVTFLTKFMTMSEQLFLLLVISLG